MRIKNILNSRRKMAAVAYNIKNTVELGNTITKLIDASRGKSRETSLMLALETLDDVMVNNVCIVKYKEVPYIINLVKRFIKTNDFTLKLKIECIIYELINKIEKDVAQQEAE